MYTYIYIFGMGEMEFCWHKPSLGTSNLADVTNFLSYLSNVFLIIL